MSVWADAVNELRADPRAPGLLIGPDVEIAVDAIIGANVVVYANSRIESGAQIQDFATIGKPSVRGRGAGESNGPTTVGRRAVVGSHAIVFTGAKLGEAAFMSDYSVLRDRSILGDRTMIGNHCAVGVDATLGDRVSVQAYTGISQLAVIEDDVFIGPFVVAVNDNSLARHGAEPLPAVRLRRACRIGGNVQINPGVEIGEEAFVAAASLVTRDVEPRAKVLGVPARKIGEVSDEELLESWRE